MISLEVRRTLVKSPPELWAEVSDPARLARHLCELGDIRIVGSDPEQMVEWEAQDTRGSVLIKPSAWGTNVTLTVLREMPEPELPATYEVSAEPELPATPPALVAQEAPDEPAPPVPWQVVVAQEPDPEPEPPAPWQVAVAQEPELELELEPRRGFFARLFGRRHKGQTSEAEQPESIDAPQPASEATGPAAPHETPIADHEREAAVGPTPWERAIGVPETEAGRRPTHDETAIATHQSETDNQPAQDETAIAMAEPETVEPAQPSPDDDHPDISAELRTAEEVASEHVKAVLTSMLDRLGAAHHRPFSRA